jgi:hypothetical protein
MPLPSTDPFTGAAGVAPNPPWTQAGITAETVNYDGAGHGKASAVNASLEVLAFVNDNTFSADQLGRLTIAGGLSPTFNYAVVVLRGAKDGTGSSFQGYEINTDGSSGAAHTEYVKWVNGAATVLGNFAATYATNDIMEGRMSGTTISLWKNGTQVGSAVDSTFSRAGAPGAGFYNFSANSMLIDDFTGDNITAAVLPDTTPKSLFPRNRLLLPARPFGPCNPVVEMKWYDFGAGTAVPINTPIGLDVASTFTPSLAESETYGISIAALSSFVAGLTRTAAYQRALSVASGWTIALTRGLSYLRTLSVSGTWTPTVGRGVSRLRSLAVSSTFTPAITRARALTLAVTGTFTAALSRAVAYGRTLSVGSTFVPALSAQAARFKTLAVGSTFGVAIARQVAYLRTLSVSSVMTALITRTRGYARAIGATSVFVPVIATRYIVGKVMAVGSTFTAAVARQFAWGRTLSVSSTFTPAVTRSTVRRITLAVAGVFSAALQWLLTQFGHDTAALTGKVRVYPRLSGVAAAYPRLAGKPRAYPQLAGTAAGYARLEGEASAMPRLEGVVRIYPKAA